MHVENGKKINSFLTTLLYFMDICYRPFPLKVIAFIFQKPLL